MPQTLNITIIFLSKRENRQLCCSRFIFCLDAGNVSIFILKLNILPFYFVPVKSSAVVRFNYSKNSRKLVFWYVELGLFCGFCYKGCGSGMHTVFSCLCDSYCQYVLSVM